MVTSFYIMKLNERTLSVDEYYSGLLNNKVPQTVFGTDSKRLTKCRACLQDGDIPITNVTGYKDIAEALYIFGNIEINDDDDNPTYLCNVCHKFLKSAILFRKVAQCTNDTLSLPLQSSDHNEHDYTECDIYLTPNNECLKVPEEEKPARKVKCPICDQVVNRSYYRKHLLHHNPELAEQYVCDICGKTFRANSLYQRHRERHETRYLFKCHLCSYVGRYKERLSLHMRVHTADLKYLCSQCPARYINRGTLSDHIKYKHTDPQYKCESCDKAFYNKLSLQRHIDVAHLGIKEHECYLCGKTFGYRRKMLEHQRNIHKTYMRPNIIKRAVIDSNNTE